MHPAYFFWKAMSRAAGEYASAGGCGPGGWHGGHEASGSEGPGEWGAGAFGVRRPLRFLAYKLELNEGQVSELARILSELKTERAQAEVDSRRTVAGFADALCGATFDELKANEAAALRVKSAERLRDAVLKALGRIHALLNEEQRNKLAYLIRTGTVTL